MKSISTSQETRWSPGRNNILAHTDSSIWCKLLSSHSAVLCKESSLENILLHNIPIVFGNFTFFRTIKFIKENFEKLLKPDRIGSMCYNRWVVNLVIRIIVILM